MQSITQDSASSNTFSAEVLGNVINGNLVVLKVSGCTKQVSIKVTDIIGETLKTLNVENGIQFINIGDHASGMLFLQISDGKNTILQKIVKQ